MEEQFARKQFGREEGRGEEEREGEAKGPPSRFPTFPLFNWDREEEDVCLGEISLPPLLLLFPKPCVQEKSGGESFPLSLSPFGCPKAALRLSSSSLSVFYGARGDGRTDG